MFKTSRKINIRDRAVLWCQFALELGEEYWYSAREEIGRRVATSKRHEIKQLQAEVRRLTAHLGEVERFAVRTKLTVDLLDMKDKLPGAYGRPERPERPDDALKIDSAERAKFEDIVRGEDPLDG